MPAACFGYAAEGSGGRRGVLSSATLTGAAEPLGGSVGVCVPRGGTGVKWLRGSTGGSFMG